MTAMNSLSARADPLYPDAKRLILASGTPSISMLIRCFRIGYTQASSLVQAMESDCLVPGELDRYTEYLQQGKLTPFLLQTIEPESR